MESSSSPEISSAINRIKAIQELTQGQILTDWPHEMLGQSETIESSLESFADVFMPLSGVFVNTVSVFGTSSSDFDNISSDQTHNRLEDSTNNVNTMIRPKVKRGCYKRRKNPMIYTEVTFNLGDDGYTWKKYGQKTIINSKHERQYYRCTYKYGKGCKATKQVQMIEDEPSKYKITYHQQHTCNNSKTPCRIISDYPNPKDDDSLVLISFETKPRKQIGFSSSVRPRHKPNKGFPSLNIKHDKVSSLDHCITWDPFAQSSKVPLEPMMSIMMSYVLDVREDIFSSTFGTSQYEIEDVLPNYDFAVFSSELCS
ncbi:hypothetical protein SSX86_010409 [Deinandra increscens subsp. villosa]|uniref:WRKY domain-containing protein n=1 Tax=Deinandra increscens subsp. villosa TaxID=3103831 RepID=A0AAP0D8X1_9ASTR